MFVCEVYKRPRDLKKTSSLLRTMFSRFCVPNLFDLGCWFFHVGNCLLCLGGLDTNFNGSNAVTVVKFMYFGHHVVTFLIVVDEMTLNNELLITN